MRYLKLYEDFTSSDKNTSTFNDILWDKGHEKNPELSNILADIEDPSSEEGEMWSDSERKKLDDFLSGIDIPGWKPGDPVEKKITDLANEFKNSMSNAQTVIDSVEQAIDSEDYAPSNVQSSEKLRRKLEELEEYLNQMDSMDGWWTDIRDRLEDNPSLGIEAKSLIDLVNMTSREVEKLQRESKYTYIGFKK